MATQITVDQLELAMLLQETIDYQRDQDIQVVLGEVLRTVMQVRRRIALSRSQYVVAMVGLSNVGKSTLLNALLGADLAPRRNGPCTAVPIEFVHGEAFRVKVLDPRQLRPPAWNCSTVEEIHHHLAILADGAGVEQHRTQAKVLVTAPLPLLSGGLILTDTPGFGAAQTNGIAGSHERALRRYLQEEVTQVFWVVLADQGIGQREKSFHDEMFAEVCDDVVVTGCEGWSREDQDRFKQRYRSAFGHWSPRFCFASGLAGLEARANQDQQALEAAGILLLESRIRELADPAKRLLALARTLSDLADDLGRWWQVAARRHSPTDRLRWRPDSWDRWRTFAADAQVVRVVRRLTKRLSAQ
jgi:GTP-binding protein EngB required for normal cell division